MTAAHLCPVCQHNHNNAPNCPNCAFDLSEYTFANTRTQKDLVAQHLARWQPESCLTTPPVTPVVNPTASANSHTDDTIAVIEYRAAVKMAWADQKLETFEIKHLQQQADSLKLSPVQTDAIEREVIGHSVREERYRAALIAVYDENSHLSLQNLQAVPILQREINLSVESAQQLEQKVLGQTLMEAILQQMQHETKTPNQQADATVLVNSGQQEQEIELLHCDIEDRYVNTLDAVNNSFSSLLLGGDDTQAKSIVESMTSQWLLRKRQRWEAWRVASKQGIPEAQLLTGIIYEDIDKDFAEAVSEYRKAAEQGLALAQLSLGSMYQDGRGVQQNDRDAYEWCRKAAEQGLALAQWSLYLMYQEGRGVQQNDRDAYEWCRKAAEQGLALAQCVLYSMYQEGRGCPQNDRDAYEWCRKAAEQGVVDAQNTLGLIYSAGQGVQQSDRDAVEWFRKAAEQGLADAQNYLGVIYSTGQGVQQSERDAVEWFRKAAEQGCANAQNNLGIIYQEGRGVQQSDRDAYEWYCKAAEQKFADAQNYLGMMYLEGRGVQQSDLDAVEWFRKAAEQEHDYGQFNLGFMYQEGRGVKKNNGEAKRWFKKAAAQGNESAKEKLKSGCFITTATINALGITNGETVLNQFRTFRDGWLSQQTFGAAAIARYYDIAPRYIDHINQQADAAAIYHWLWSDYLASCHNQLQQNDYRAAYHTYRSMLAALSQGFPELD
jgi:TPR repeat protein